MNNEQRQRGRASRQRRDKTENKGHDVAIKYDNKALFYQIIHLQKVPLKKKKKIQSISYARLQHTYTHNTVAVYVMSRVRVRVRPNPSRNTGRCQVR